MTIPKRLVRLTTIAAAITTAPGCDLQPREVPLSEPSTRGGGGPGDLTGPNKLNTSFLGDGEDYPLDNLPLLAGSDPNVRIIEVRANECTGLTGMPLFGHFTTAEISPDVTVSLSSDGVLGSMQMARVGNPTELCTVSGPLWAGTYWEVAVETPVQVIETDLRLQSLALDGHGSTLYEWEVNYSRVIGKPTASPDYRPLCDENDELGVNQSLAFHAYLVPGLRLGPSASFVVANPADTMFIACRSGAVGKTASWGYAPWDVGTDVHALATRAARADYCGTGVANTTVGTPIWLQDTLGLWPDAPVAGYVKEAVWDEDSGRALCVSQPRLATTPADPYFCPLMALPTCDQLPANVGGSDRITIWVPTP